MGNPWDIYMGIPWEIHSMGHIHMYIYIMDRDFTIWKYNNGCHQPWEYSIGYRCQQRDMVHGHHGHPFHNGMPNTIL